MPIYDNNGSASTQIGKLYDYNGSANTQIGKVYDNNGSASSLIYTSDIVFIGANSSYTSGWTTLSGLGGAYKGSLTASGNSMIQNTGQVSWTNHGGAGNARTSAAIDLTSFSTLYFTVSNYSNASKGRVGFSTSAAPSGTTDELQLYALNRYVEYTGNGTFSVNVANLSGNYYLFLQLLAYIDSANRIGQAYYSNMYLI